MRKLKKWTGNLYERLMEIIYAESAIDYASYTFPYGVYCVAESEAEFPEIYAQGFLPYTDRTQLSENIFYKARSLRAYLPELTSTSENRRTDRKLAELDIQTEWVPIKEFDIYDEEFRNLCNAYTQERFHHGQMAPERLDYVLKHDLSSYIWACTSHGKRIGYVLLSVHGKMVHYWYAFMSLSYLFDFPVGKWMMWNVLKEAAEKGYKYCYLGTVYGRNALYKVRDHNALQFYDGRGWNTDIKMLKSLCKGDEERGVADAFKLSKDPATFIKSH